MAVLDAVGDGDCLQIGNEADNGAHRIIGTLPAPYIIGNLRAEHDIVHREIRQAHHGAGVAAEVREHEMEAAVAQIPDGAGSESIGLLEQVFAELEADAVGGDFHIGAAVHEVMLDADLEQDADGHVHGEPLECDLALLKEDRSIESLLEFEPEELNALIGDLGDIAELFRSEHAELGGIEMGARVQESGLAAGNITNDAVVKLHGTQAVNAFGNGISHAGSPPDDMRLFHIIIQQNGKIVNRF